MNELDNRLSRIATAPVHASLAAIEDAVFAGLVARRSHIPASTIALAAVAALMVGVAGAGFPVERAEAASSVPFGAPPALAPSTLLGNSQ